MLELYIKKYVLNVVKHLNLCKKMQFFCFFYTNTEGTSYGRPEGLPLVVKEVGVWGLVPANKK